MIYPATYKAQNSGVLSELSQLNRAINQLFGDHTRACDNYPPLNIDATEEQAVITAELPGFDLDDIQITVKSNYVTLEGKRAQPEYEGNVTVHRGERGYGTFIRSVSLPYEINNDQVKATYKNGMLQITLPRAESSKPRQIEITSD